MTPAVFFVSTAILTTLGTGIAVWLLGRKAILDVPNERSSHSRPTPKGGGLAVVPIVLAAWLIASVWPPSSPAPWALLWVIAGAAVLAAVSWLDDLKGLGPLLRLAVQFLVAGWIVFAVPPGSPLFQGLLPGWLDQGMMVLMWVGFANIFNFMDGIDGISVIEILGVGLGVAVLHWAVDGPAGTIVMAAAIAGGGLGFLKWNWPPARIFLGDVGSVPMGFLLGWLLLDLAISGYWAAAIIIPLYYLADSGITLARRMVQGQKFWQAHRSHFYQRAVATGHSHGGVSKTIGLCNLALIAFALVSLKNPAAGIAAGAFTAFVTLVFLKRQPARTHP